MKFNRQIFFNLYREKFGKLSPLQVSGLSELLDFIEADKYIQKIPYASYIAATTKHETAATYHPIHEYGGKAYFIKRYGGQTKKGKELGNDTPEEGYFYAGKGYPQATGEANYEKAEAAIRKEYPEIVADFEKRTGKTFDLTVGDQPDDESDPANMMDPAIAYATMSYGMRKGMFTGHRLSDHLDENPPNYRAARKIINGTDQDIKIANIAKKFQEIFTASQDSAVAPIVSHNQGVQDSSKPSDPTSDQPPPTINIENAQKVINEPAPVPPKSEPETVKIERVSIWAKISAGFAALTGLGINMSNVIETKLNEINLVQLGYVMGGIALIALALWAYDRAQTRAHEKTLAKVDTASDPTKNTVQLER